MRQDSETNIIVLNTALKYKIPREKNTITHKHILKRAIAEARKIYRTQRTFKTFIEEKLIMLINFFQFIL